MWHQMVGAFRNAIDGGGGGGPVSLAGVNFRVSVTPLFQFDLPSTGIYNVTGAWGDASFAQTVSSVTLSDNVTTFATINGGTTGAGNAFWDATNVLRTSQADWIANKA